MRIDSHTHIPDRDVIEKLGRVVLSEGITHYLAILNDLNLIEHLDKAGAQGIPFQRLRNPSVQTIDLHPDERIGGYKLHLRHPTTQNDDGQTVTIAEEHIGHICRGAARVGRPLLFHTDADQPEICSLPMLAQLAGHFTEVNFIAAHTGVYTGEYQGEESTPERWEAICRSLLKKNLELLIEVRNLYADTALLGRDSPERSSDPDFKLKSFIEVVDEFSPTQKKELAKKLFIATDFPCFWNPDDPKSSYGYQVDCLRKVLKSELDEEGMAQGFLNLIPEECRSKLGN